MNHVPLIEITFTAVEANDRVFWFTSEEQARQFCRDRWDNETDGVPFIKHYTLRSQEELVALLNERAR
jgi:hypothetical protein